MQAGLAAAAAMGRCRACVRSRVALARRALARAWRQPAAAMGADVPYASRGRNGARPRRAAIALFRLTTTRRRVGRARRFHASASALQEAFGWWDRQVGQAGGSGGVGQDRQAGPGTGRQGGTGLHERSAARWWPRHPIRCAALVGGARTPGAFQASLSGQRLCRVRPVRRRAARRAAPRERCARAGPAPARAGSPGR